MKREAVYSRLAQKLAGIANEFGLIHKWHQPNFKIRRTYAGRHQKAAGGWVFYLVDDNGREIFGSCDRASEFLKAYKENRLSYLNMYGSSELIVESKPIAKRQDRP